MTRRRTLPIVSQVSGAPVSPFGVWLLDRLARRGWNQQQFCAESGIADSTLANWLYHGNLPRPKTCGLIADALHIPVWRVLEAAGLPYDGLRGIPRNDLRRAVWGKLEAMTDEQVRAILDAL